MAKLVNNNECIMCKEKNLVLHVKNAFKSFCFNHFINHHCGRMLGKYQYRLLDFEHIFMHFLRLTVLLSSDIIETDTKRSYNERKL